VLSWELLEELFWNIKTMELHLWFMRFQRDIFFRSYLVHTYVYKLFGLIWTLWSLCRILLCNSDNVDLLLSACKNETTKGVIFVLQRSAHMSWGYLHDKHTPPDILLEDLYSSMLNLLFLEWLLQLHTIVHIRKI
jgi:hypothetical protein